MVLEKGLIPPNANFESLNHKIDADFLNIKVRGAVDNFSTFDLALICDSFRLE